VCSRCVVRVRDLGNWENNEFILPSFLFITDEFEYLRALLGFIHILKAFEHLGLSLVHQP
jgi:hypothetical protein